MSSWSRAIGSPGAGCARWKGVGFAAGFKNLCFSEGFDDYCAEIEPALWPADRVARAPLGIAKTTSKTGWSSRAQCVHKCGGTRSD